MRYAFVCLICLLFTVPAYAEGRITAGGKVNLRTVDTVSNENVVDIYSRQLRYRQSRIAFRRDLEARRESFASPQIRAWESYQNQLADLNENRQDWDGNTR